MGETSNTNVIDVAASAEFQHASEAAAMFIGEVVSKKLLRIYDVHETAPLTTLDMLHLAESGDEQAWLSVAANVHTELVEWTRKTKNIVQSRSWVNEDGQVSQHTHNWRHVQANTILYRQDAILQSRAPIETTNNFRIETAIQNGTLQNYWFVASSLVPDNLTPEQADKVGFFGDSMSASIQATTLDSYGVLTESAFVAAVDSRGGLRFDVDTLRAVYNFLGVGISSCNTEEILARPLLIHKSIMPNGVSDFVKLYDYFAGSQRFFGVKDEIGIYDSFADVCREREKEFNDLAATITQRLIAERHELTHPDEFVKRLSYLAKHYLVQRAIVDNSIDLRVFGAEAAHYLAASRWHLEQGNTKEAEQAIEMAHKTAMGGSCVTYSPADGTFDPTKEDWSGGKKEKFAKCQSCKSFKLEIGGCKICEDCVKRPWVREKAWADFLKEQKKQKAEEDQRAKQLRMLHKTDESNVIAPEQVAA